MRSWHIAEPRRVAVEKFTRASWIARVTRARTVVTGPVSRTTRPHSPLTTQAHCFYELRLASVTVRRCACSEIYQI